MKRTRKPRLVQSYREPDYFVELNEQPGKNFWRVTVADAIYGDCPSFDCAIPKKGHCFTPREIAIAGAAECTNSEETVVVQEFRDNIPVFSSVWSSMAGIVVCTKSSDPERAEPVVMPPLAEIRTAFDDARKRRREKTLKK